jgi:alkylation response protein AidB-like acyl-CoA dehydrogenase
MTSSATVPLDFHRGGAFLLGSPGGLEVFTPEDFSDEQRMLAETAKEFTKKEVLPRTGDLMALRYDATRDLMKKAGEIGLLAIEIPEAYGGLDLGKVTGCLASEISALDGSWCTTYMGHNGIGSLPIVYFGTDAQKAKYLPKFASGEWISSYSLSEASSASDAMNAKAKAVLSPDGETWILNGEKMWLTNAGFADVYITFAKVDGEKFTAFIIDKGSPGVSLGPEERKTGIKGSSTRPLILQDARIPKENLLGEIGKGHKIAFNILNIGRFKLGAGVTGGAKVALAAAAAYAKSRKAFDRTVADFPLIQAKLGEMTARTFASESLVYRVAGLIDRNLEGADTPALALKRIEEYDVECSIVKVFASEVLGYVTDEGVQIFGGAGYVEDYPAERYWRDARINRIFEGTNEINRLLVPGRLIRRAMSGELPLFDAAMALLDESADKSSDQETVAESPELADLAPLVAGSKKAALMIFGAAAQRYQAKLSEEQEVLSDFADVAIESLALESAWLRARRMRARGALKADAAAAAVRVFAEGAVHRMDASARRALPTALSNNEALLSRAWSALGTFLPRQPRATIPLRRTLARAVLDHEAYPF